jgi:GNAT superfamily N-acetyltransferase
MVGELVPVPVDPMTADRRFWTRFHEIRRLRHMESRPDDPVQPDHDVEAKMKKPDTFDSQHYFEVSRNGVMLGWFHGSAVTPKNPEYETNKHLLWADGYVRPDERRKGIGSRGLSVIADLMDRVGATVVGFSARQDSGHSFLGWLPAEQKLTDIESRLHLPEVDWEMVERWVEEGAKRSPQTRVEIYDDGIPVEMWADYSAQRSALLNTIPFESLEIGDIVITPERIREWYERMALTGEVAHELLAREQDGVISAMTDVSWAPYRPTHIEQQFTGVLPSARGRGLGKWIKAAMLLHVRKLHADAEWIITENAQSNDPMLNINRRLGFRETRRSTEYQMGRDQLEKRIRSL